MTQDYTKCPFWGVGGRYIADPVTAVRTRIEPAHAPAAVAKPLEAPAAAVQQPDQPNGDAVKYT
jgi:hypothetical protein